MKGSMSVNIAAVLSLDTACLLIFCEDTHAQEGVDAYDLYRPETTNVPHSSTILTGESWLEGCTICLLICDPNGSFMRAIGLVTGIVLTGAACASTTQSGSVTNTRAAAECGNNAAITVPAGFCATVFADSVTRARYLAVADNGDVYVASEGTRPNQTGPTPAFYALRDTDKDGHADRVEKVGQTGNTGIALWNGYLYVDQGDRITRYRRAAGDLVPSGAAETIVSGLPLNPGHRARNFAISSDGTMYVNVGSPSNSCQVKDRALESPGKDPCEELATRAGIWKFSATTPNQQFSPQARFATGARNSTGMALSGGRLYAMTHGRDQLTQNWPKVFPDTAYSDNNPAEKLLQINQGDDFGWPYCYYAFDKKTLVDAPEYGGDGTKTTRCASKKAPLAVYPAHWSPLDLLFYNGSNFPAKYRGGAFITFHGSWNRAKGMQAGGKIVFQPMNNGSPSGQYEIFADGFAGVPPEEIDGQKAHHRPVGLAVGPDGALYVADDKGGRIYRITYSGGSQ
jgi:glucose/arabinose dehydrogenase